MYAHHTHTEHLKIHILKHRSIKIKDVNIWNGVYIQPNYEIGRLQIEH